MAREMYDIRLSDELAPVIAAGDFQIVESTERHQQLLLLYDPGTMSNDLLAGVGIGGYILTDTDEVVVEKEIEREFRGDGMSIRKLDVRSLEDVRIDAFYR
jgi:hypothetical protein